MSVGSPHHSSFSVLGIFLCARSLQKKMYMCSESSGWDAYLHGLPLGFGSKYSLHLCSEGAHQLCVSGLNEFDKRIYPAPPEGPASFSFVFPDCISQTMRGLEKERPCHPAFHLEVALRLRSLRWLEAVAA